MQPVLGRGTLAQQSKARDPRTSRAGPVEAVRPVGSDSRVNAYGDAASYLIRWLPGAVNRDFLIVTEQRRADSTAVVSCIKADPFLHQLHAFCYRTSIVSAVYPSAKLGMRS